MFGDSEKIKHEALEDETLESEGNNPYMSGEAKPISVEQLEKQTFSNLEQQKPNEGGFGQNQMQQPPPFGNNQNQQNFGMTPPNFQQFQGNNPPMAPPQQQPPQ